MKSAAVDYAKGNLTMSSKIADDDAGKILVEVNDCGDNKRKS